MKFGTKIVPNIGEFFKHEVWNKDNLKSENVWTLNFIFYFHISKTFEPNFLKLVSKLIEKHVIALMYLSLNTYISFSHIHINVVFNAICKILYFIDVATNNNYRNKPNDKKLLIFLHNKCLLLLLLSLKLQIIKTKNIKNKQIEQQSTILFFLSLSSQLSILFVVIINIIWSYQMFSMSLPQIQEINIELLYFCCKLL